MSNQASLHRFWKSSSNSNGTPARNNTNNNSSNQVTLTPEQRAQIARKRQAALERRRQRENQQKQQQNQNQTPRNGHSAPYSSTLTPAINKMAMTAHNNSNSNKNNVNNSNRTPLTVTNTTPATNNKNNINQRSVRKRSRQQYNEDSDDSPIQPRKKKRRSNQNNSGKNADSDSDSDDDWNPNQNDLQQSSEESYHSPSTSPKRNNRKLKRTVSNLAQNSDYVQDDGDVPIIDNSNNHNHNNHNTPNAAIDALDRIATFGLVDDDDGKQREPVSRDSKYKCNSYAQYKRRSATLNAPTPPTKKASGASHRDVSQSKWYKHPKDLSGHSPGHPNYNPSQIYVPQKAFAAMTPTQAHFWKLKTTRFDGILFYKIGKFYELYGHDADLGHKLCGLGYMPGGGAPHVGFPEKSFPKYAESFVKHGKKVYRVEQTETVAEQKKKKHKVVTREVCEVYSRGTIVPEELLEGSLTNFLLSIAEEDDCKMTSSIAVAVCYMDFSTGAVHVGRFTDDRNRSRLRTLIYQTSPAEVVYKKGALSKETQSLLKQDARQSQLTALSAEQCYDAVQTQGIIKGEAYWDRWENYPAVLARVWAQDLTMAAVGQVLYMLQETMHDHEILPHSAWNVYDPTSTKCSRFLTLDGSTLANLEILRNDEGTRRGTLIEFVDHCQSKCGKRMLETWLRAPLNQLEAINERLDAVEYLIEDWDYWTGIEVQSKLKALPDLERILLHLAVLGMKNRAMDKAVMFEDCWKKAKVEKFLKALDGFDAVNSLLTEIDRHRKFINSQLVADITTIVTVPNVADDGEEDENEFETKMNDRHMFEFGSVIDTFRDSFDAELAANESIISPVPGKNEDFDEIEEKLKRNSNLLEKILRDVQREYKSTKIRWWSKKNGKKAQIYNLEIPKELHIDPPEEWHHRTSTTKVDRYHTDEILDLLDVKDKLENDKETLLRDAARLTFEKFAKHGVIWKKVAQNIAILDCLLCLAQTSRFAPGFDMVRPQFIKHKTAFLEMRECRHPCIDESYLNKVGQIGGAATFIPNDTVLGCKENAANFVIVTGPNMGGKSTLLRQTCVAVILAHIGCYVPCESMILTPVDRIFTRVGANDRILAGQSTFMVELEETSSILDHATANSLVILDELGRGTSTFDGTAIAFAVAERLIDVIKCRCLFSTHYHGLCDSFAGNEKVANYHMGFKENTVTNSITFLYKFTKGICKNSHGINCAKMAFDVDQFGGMLERAEKKAKILKDRMHSDQDLSNEKELLRQFEGLMGGLMDGNLYQKIQADIKNKNETNNMCG